MNITDLRPKIGWGGAQINTVLYDALVGLTNDSKLGHVKTALVDGASAGTAITLAGAASGDELLFALAFVGAGSDITDVALITEATFDTDSITFPVDTSGSKVLVVWVDVDARNVT